MKIYSKDAKADRTHALEEDGTWLGKAVKKAPSLLPLCVCTHTCACACM